MYMIIIHQYDSIKITINRIVSGKKIQVKHNGSQIKMKMNLHYIFYYKRQSPSGSLATNTTVIKQVLGLN
jgi:hypothetical protein